MAALLVLVTASAPTAFGGDSCKWVKYESGKFWCNERYLYSDSNPFDSKHLDAAKRGYLYALAAALVMQTESEACHRFNAPSRLVEIQPRPPATESGFEATTFEVYSVGDPNEIEEVVIAFAGTDELRDWKTNLGSEVQYTEASEYTAAVAKRYPGKRLVVTGYSLGGGLALHVTYDEKTKPFVAECWALNPSPIVHAPVQIDSRTWLAASRKDIVKVIRHGGLGAPPTHVATKYYLIKSHRTYAHFRWVLARNMLIAADIALQDPLNPTRTTEPLEILKSSKFSACGDAGDLMSRVGAVAH